MASKINVFGEQAGLVAGQDIVYGDKIEVRSVGFEEPRLDDVKPPRYESPALALALVERLRSQRLLILSGPRLEDKDPIARHLAWRLKEVLDGDSDRLQIKQWSQPVEGSSLRAEMARETTPTVFLLTELSPSLVRVDLRQLHAEVRTLHHFVIATTDHGADQWLVEGDLLHRDLWIECTTEDFYGSRYLADLLTARVAGMQKDLPAGLLSETEESEARLVGVPVGELATRLRTPGRIDEFLAWLVAAGSDMDADQIRDRLEGIDGDAAAVDRWYHGLSLRGQLLALALALFEGLFDDQAFAALEELVGQAWRQRDLGLRSFDYSDLQEVQAFFAHLGLVRGAQRVEVSSPRVRQRILQAGFRLQRRALVSGLPVLADLVRASVKIGKDAITAPDLVAPVGKAGAEGPKTRSNPPSTNGQELRRQRLPENGPASERLDAEVLTWKVSGAQRELYGSSLRRQILRNSLAETLSLTGLLTPETLDPILRRLASDSTLQVQVVAAKALAGWRDSMFSGGDDNLLFKKLREWNDRALQQELLSEEVGTRPNMQQRALSRLRSTVALTVSYASLYDRPNCLAPELVGFFEALIGERDRRVRAAFREVTLPLMASLHLKQLEPLLRMKALEHNDLVGGVARGLTRAYELSQEDAVEVLESWYSRCRAERILGEPADSPSTRERMLGTVILAYAGVDCLKRDGLLATEVVFSKFKRVLEEEVLFFVRRLAVLSAFGQAGSAFAVAAPLLQDLFEEVTLGERGLCVAGLVEIYLSQRAGLEGGESWLEVAGTEYPIWIQAERPLTALEEEMLRWIQDDTAPVAGQIALEAYVAFRETDLDRAEEDHKLRAMLPGQSHQVTSASKTIRSRVRLRKLETLGRLIVALVVPEGSLRRRTVSCLLPEFNLLRSTSRTVEALIEKWRGGRDPDVASVATHLVRAAEWYRARWWLIVATLLVALGILFVRWPGQGG